MAHATPCPGPTVELGPPDKAARPSGAAALAPGFLAGLPPPSLAILVPAPLGSDECAGRRLPFPWASVEPYQEKKSAPNKETSSRPKTHPPKPSECRMLSQSRGNYFWIILGGREKDHLHFSFRLAAARPPTDHRTPRPVLRNTGAQAWTHPTKRFNRPVRALEELMRG